VRSYRVLEQADKARAAEADARRALANDRERLARFEDGIKPPVASPHATDQAASDKPASDQVASAPAASSAAPAAPSAQDQMIRGMVDRLAARLQQDGSDVDSWLQLVRSYTVLNDADKMRAAEADARRALAGDAAKLARLEAGLKQIGSPPAASTAAPPAPAVSSAAPSARRRRRSR
jgi:cytochrome c-type biogenesis protein CcmH